MDRLTTKPLRPNRAIILDPETECCRFEELEASLKLGCSTEEFTSTPRLPFICPLALDLSFMLPDFLASPEDRAG